MPGIQICTENHPGPAARRGGPKRPLKVFAVDAYLRITEVLLNARGEYPCLA